MKKYFFMAIIFFGIFGVAGNSWAARNISLPFSLNFDQDNYQDLVWLSAGNGAIFTHLDQGCWSGQCAKFTPPTIAIAAGINGGMAGLGHFMNLNASRLNIRLLMKVSNSYASTIANGGGGIGNKFIDVHSADDVRTGIFYLNGYYTADDPPNMQFLTFANMLVPSQAAYFYGGLQRQFSTFRISDVGGGTSYEDQWICVEYELDNINNVTKSYIWTQDGVFAGEYISATSDIQSNANYFYIGGYYNHYHPTADSNTYILFDELAIDDNFIGPPAGFLNESPDNTPPSAPGGLSVI